MPNTPLLIVERLLFERDDCNVFEQIDFRVGRGEIVQIEGPNGSGKTTTLFALNSSQDSKIYTITLRPDDITNISFNKSDTKVAIRNAINESIYNQFIFNNMSVQNKINLIFMRVKVNLSCIQKEIYLL